MGRKVGARPAASRASRPARPDSSDSDSAGEVQVQVQEAAYKSLQLADALHRRCDFAAAALELAAILRHLYASGCTKAVQALIVEDAELAIACCDGRLQSRAALAALMEAAERALPRAKQKALLASYRRSAVQLQRRERRGGGGGGLDEGEDEEEEAAAPATVAHLPIDVLALVLRHLGPLSLARCSLVCREWRAAASDDALWRPHCEAVEAACGGSSGSGDNSIPWWQRFAAAVAERLLPWQTNRVLLPGGRLGWLPDGAPRPAPRCRHLDAAGVVALLRRTRRRGSSSDGSDSDSGGGGCAGEGVSQQLRFWKLS